MEFDLTRGDSQLVPCHHSPYGSATVARRQRANHQRRWGCSQPQPLDVVPRITSAFQWTGRFQLLQTVVSSEILDTLEQEMPVTVPDSDSQLSRNVLCEVDNTNQRSSRRLVLFGDRGPAQESMAEVATAHNSVETTPKDGEPCSRVEDHPRTLRWRMWRTRTCVVSVATVVSEAIPDDPAEEDDRESLWSFGGDLDLESADDVEEEVPFRHPGVRSFCSWGSGRPVV